MKKKRKIHVFEPSVCETELLQTYILDFKNKTMIFQFCTLLEMRGKA